jgi:hypothetical protein
MPAARFNTFANQNLAFLREQIPSNLLALFLVSYAGRAAPMLPYQLRVLLKAPAVRILVLFLVVWTNNQDPTVALGLALALVIGMNLLSGRGAFETFLIEHNTDVVPSCRNITISNILDGFGGSETKMYRALHNSGFPHSVDVTDYNAPIVASFLVNKGYQFGACGPPSS